jgi:hypothetical protein
MAQTDKAIHKLIPLIILLIMNALIQYNTNHKRAPNSIAVPSPNIHIFSQKMKMFAAITHLQNRRGNNKNKPLISSPSPVLHHTIDKPTLPKEVLNGSYKDRNTSEPKLVSQANKNLNDSQLDLRDFYKRNFSPDVRVNFFKPLHICLHSDKPQGHKTAQSLDLYSSEEVTAKLLAKELGLSLKGDSCPYDAKGSIGEYQIGKEIGIRNKQGRERMPW